MAMVQSLMLFSLAYQRDSKGGSPQSVCPLINLFRDNPSIKAVFVVRDPIERFVSHFKFTIGDCQANGLQTPSDVVDYLFHRSNNSLIHEMKSAAEIALSQIRSQKVVAFLSLSSLTSGSLC
jgi:hypothetical protein